MVLFLTIWDEFQMKWVRAHTWHFRHFQVSDNILTDMSIFNDNGNWYGVGTGTQNVFFHILLQVWIAEHVSGQQLGQSIKLPSLNTE